VLSRQEEMHDRRETLRQDLSVQRQQREQQTGTFLSHTHSDLGGRYAIVSPQTIVGAEPTINYPAASSPWQVELPKEEPLGYAIDQMPLDDLGPPAAQGVGDASAASSTAPPLGERDASLLSRDLGPPVRATNGPPAPSTSPSPMAGGPSFSQFRRRKV
jgi:hypothetical protein